MELSGIAWDRIDFKSGLPDLNLFPRKIWAGIIRDVYLESTARDLAYGEPEGRIELRDAIAQHLARIRGIKIDPELILITAGTTQAIGLITRILCGQSSEKRRNSSC